jgi:hypothetical protein
MTVMNYNESYNAKTFHSPSAASVPDWTCPLNYLSGNRHTHRFSEYKLSRPVCIPCDETATDI